MATINFAPGLDPTKLSQRSRDTLEHVLDASANPSCTITCLGRSPREQAAVMRANCLRDLAEQRRTYLAPGLAVIDVFTRCLHLDERSTLDQMEAEIIRQGPSRVSRHCGDQSVLQVLDLAQSTLLNKGAFEALAQSHGSLISKCLDENHCVHVEIPQLALRQAQDERST